MRKKTVIGILAHVDAGKTTCIESMLFNSRQIRKMGRVDHRDALLDYDENERSHGITIYAKEAYLPWQDTDIYVIDTPGHVDFSSEMERSLQVLDLAVILINAQDGVQSHTRTIWRCLEQYHVPALIFINKMDISYRSAEELLADLRQHCSEDCIDFSAADRLERLAMVSDDMLNAFMETGTVSDDLVRQAVSQRLCFPVLSGSALKNQGISELLDLIVRCAPQKEYPDVFGARVYKISTDPEGNRLTHMKITGGILSARQRINEQEKADQIRIYSGPEYRMVQQAEAGMICAVKGLVSVETGQGLGYEENRTRPLLQACMDYELLVPEGTDMLRLSETCRRIADEDPQLMLTIDPVTRNIHIRIMGEMQKEILEDRIRQACGVSVGFSSGGILYQETIAAPVIGVGHFEPLRHYAEVVLKLSPLPRGRGLLIDSECPVDNLSLSWQKSIFTSLRMSELPGILTGSPLTDMRITILNGRAHPKHTEGGDFREAALRAVRMGLMKAGGVLLEPMVSYTVTLPQEYLSRALYDLEQHQASVQIREAGEGQSVISGRGPLRLMRNYQQDVTSYTRGRGTYEAVPDGYAETAEQEALVTASGYDPERDLAHPSASVFCEHGSGFAVPWYEVEDHMHLELQKETNNTAYQHRRYQVSAADLNRLNDMAGGKNRKEDTYIRDPRKPLSSDPVRIKVRDELPTCMIIDGYNMIYGWDSMKALAEIDITTAREKLIDELFSYQAYLGHRMILVFDGYRRPDNYGTSYRRGKDMKIVYTRTNQTADQYIEEITGEMKKKYNLIVVTSDNLIQNAVFAQGAMRMSARELENQIRFRRGQGSYSI